MGVSGRLDENMILFTLEGENTVQQAKKAFVDIFSRPDLPSRLPVLIDARLSQRNRGLSEVSGFAESLLHFREKIGARCALVINEQRRNSPELERLLAGFSLREKIQFGLFFELKAAIDWLKDG